MVLALTIEFADGALTHVPLNSDAINLAAIPGAQYRFKSQSGSIDTTTVQIVRTGEDLIVFGLPGTGQITISRFFDDCQSGEICQLHLDALDTGTESITPFTQAKAAAADGSFILWAPATLAADTTVPQTADPASGQTSLSAASMTLLGLSAVSVAALTNSGSDNPVGSDPQINAPDSPVAGSDPIKLAVLSADVAGTESPLSNGAITNDASPTLSGSLSRPLGEGESLVIYRSGTNVGEPVVNGTQWMFDDLLSTDGDYAYRVELIDQDGNGQTASGAFILRVDTTAPERPTLDAVERDNRITNAEAADGVTFSGVAQAGTIITVNWDGDVRTSTTEPDGAWSIFYDPLPVDAGRAPVRVTATDEAGNRSEERFRYITVDGDAAVGELNALLGSIVPPEY